MLPPKLNEYFYIIKPNETINQKGSRMRKLLISCLVLVSSFAVAELAVNEATGKFYSKGASSKVDQNEYHNLFLEYVAYANQRGPGPLSSADIAVYFVRLKTSGTPAALRLKHDLEELIKIVRADMRRIEKL